MGDQLVCRDSYGEEQIDGKAVSSLGFYYNHNRIAENIDFIFRTYLKGGAGVPLGSGHMLYLTPTDRFLPDFMVVCDPAIIRRDGVHGAPDLVVEVITSATVARDRMYKQNLYGKSGVKEYWIVSPESRFIEVYRPHGGVLTCEDVHVQYPDYMLAAMSEAEGAEVEASFRCKLFPDLTLSIDEIFDGLMP